MNNKIHKDMKPTSQTHNRPEKLFKNPIPKYIFKLNSNKPHAVHNREVSIPTQNKQMKKVIQTHIHNKEIIHKTHSNHTTNKHEPTCPLT